MVSNYWTLLFYELRINLLNISLMCSLARYLNIILDGFEYNKLKQIQP